MSNSRAMDRCAHCGIPMPLGIYEGHLRDHRAWSIHPVRHGQCIVKVAVCPACRQGKGRVNKR